RAKRNHWLLCLSLAVQVTFASAAGAKDIVVFAAASLKNGLDEASAAYQREVESKVLISYAASSALAKQIENGAPADLFISADLGWMDYLQQHGLIQTPLILLGNRL